MSDAFLILENGAVFKGRSFGEETEAVGEIVFSTGMTGYMETLSDPRYFGQIVLQTFPPVGNYGVIREEMRSPNVHLKAYIVREWCREPSNFRSEGNLDNFLRSNRIPGLFDIDTRALTRIIRDNGTMNAMVSKTAELSEDQWAKLREHKITGAVAAVKHGDGPFVSHFETKDPSPCFKVALWDFGDAFRMAEELIARGCAPVICRYDMTADDIFAGNPDGVVLSEGPGDPAENTGIIREIKKLCYKNIPIFGVGLGHQMLALARGAKTEKLPFGHHGANQTVKECGTGRVFVTSQNHGFAVARDLLPAAAELSYINLNDETCEGLDYSDIPAFSVQFTPTEEILTRFGRRLCR